MLSPIQNGEQPSSNNFERLYEDLRECPQEQQKDFVQANYHDMMTICQDPVLSKFVDIKKSFSECENKMKTINDEIQDLKYARIKSKVLEADIDEEVSEESDDEEERSNNAISKEQQKAEEQLSEMLDNLSSSTYEKSYKEAIQYYQILRDMVKSEMYGSIIRQREIKKIIEQCYQTLCELLLSDFESENPVFPQADLIVYLIQIDQHSALVEKYLMIKTKKLSDQLQKYFNSTFGLDIEELEKSCQQFLKFVVGVCEEFENNFKEVLSKNEFIFAQISSWIEQMLQSFYNDISPSLFQSYDFEEILNILKQLINQFNDYEQYGLALSHTLQVYIGEDLDLKFDDLFFLYNQKIKYLLDMNSIKLYPTFQLKVLAYSEEELIEPNVKPITEISIDSIVPIYLRDYFKMFPQEVKAKPTSTIKSLLTETQQPCGIVGIYFWNVCFMLVDATLNFLNPDSIQTLSTKLVQLVQGKLKQFIIDYLKSLKQKVGSILQPNNETTIFWIATFYSGFTFSNLLTQYLSIRKSKVTVAVQPDWVSLTQTWYNEVRSVIQTLFNGSLIEQIPYWFADVGRVYCQKLQTPQLPQRPSNLFLTITSLINQSRQSLMVIIPKQPLNYFLAQLNDQINYIIEYILYWSYHNLGKTNEVFFMEKKERERLNLNNTQLHLFLSQNALKLSYFTNDGIQQFIYDMTFLPTYYTKYLLHPNQISNDTFLKKVLSLYNKEKNTQIDYKSISDSFQSGIEKYISKQFEQDIVQLNQYFKKSNKVPVQNYVFRQSQMEF